MLGANITHVGWLVYGWFQVCSAEIESWSLFRSGMPLLFLGSLPIHVGGLEPSQQGIVCFCGRAPLCLCVSYEFLCVAICLYCTLGCVCNSLWGSVHSATLRWRGVCPNGANVCTRLSRWLGWLGQTLLIWNAGWTKGLLNFLLRPQWTQYLTRGKPDKQLSTKKILAHLLAIWDSGMRSSSGVFLFTANCFKHQFQKKCVHILN